MSTVVVVVFVAAIAASMLAVESIVLRLLCSTGVLAPFTFGVRSGINVLATGLSVVDSNAGGMPTGSVPAAVSELLALLGEVVVVVLVGGVLEAALLTC